MASVAFSVVGLVLTANLAEVPNGAELALLQKQNVLIIFNEIYRVVMVVLFTSFAYHLTFSHALNFIVIPLTFEKSHVKMILLLHQGETHGNCRYNIYCKKTFAQK